mmetsp:Transcript_18297/g.36999  ORF Transcript_18297/g.36999 Transcript_18297/m.36999 type:complete len:297 (-) Transcript_18297:944-1834(-)
MRTATSSYRLLVSLSSSLGSRTRDASTSAPASTVAPALDSVPAFASVGTIASASAIASASSAADGLVAASKQIVKPGTSSARLHLSRLPVPTHSSAPHDGSVHKCAAVAPSSVIVHSSGARRGLNLTAAGSRKVASRSSSTGAAAITSLPPTLRVKQQGGGVSSFSPSSVIGTSVFQPGAKAGLPPGRVKRPLRSGTALVGESITPKETRRGRVPESVLRRARTLADATLLPSSISLLRFEPALPHGVLISGGEQPATGCEADEGEGVDWIADVDRQTSSSSATTSTPSALLSAGL